MRSLILSQCIDLSIGVTYVSYAAANSSDFKQRLNLLKVFADLVDVPRQFQT